MGELWIIPDLRDQARNPKLCIPLVDIRGQGIAQTDSLQTAPHTADTQDRLSYPCRNIIRLLQASPSKKQRTERLNPHLRPDIHTVTGHAKRMQVPRIVEDNAAHPLAGQLRSAVLQEAALSAATLSRRIQVGIGASTPDELCSHTGSPQLYRKVQIPYTS